MGWNRKFDPPIEGFPTLRDAASHIMKLPAAEQKKKHWQTAADTILQAAEDRGPMLHAVIGMNQALHHGKAPRDPAPRRKATKKYRIVR